MSGNVELGSLPTCVKVAGTYIIMGHYDLPINLRGGFQELAVPHQRWVWDVAFSADSQYVLTACSDGVARLWHLPTNEVRKEFQGHSKALTSLAFRDGHAA